MKFITLYLWAKYWSIVEGMDQNATDLFLELYNESLDEKNTEDNL